MRMHNDHDVSNGIAVSLAGNTELKRMECTLQESKERLQLFIEHAPASLAMFDTDMRYLSVSRRWLKDYGLGERDLTGASHYDIFPEITAEWREAHRRGLAGEVLRAGGDRFERADGSVQWVRWELRPWYDAQGKVGGIVIFTEDITEIKLAEQASRESESRYRNLFENMLDGFAYCRMLFDDLDRPTDFVYLEVNSSFGRLTGLEDVKGKKVTEVIPGIKESNPELFEIYGRVALTGQTKKFEIEVKPLGIWFSISAYSPERGYFVAVFDNITERKRSEEVLQQSNDNLELRVKERTEELLATLDTLSQEITERQRAENLLRQSEERYRKVVEDQTETINRFNADGKLTYVNEVFCRVFGKTSDELLGSKWHPRAFPDDVPFIEEQLRRLSPSNPVVVIENRIYSASGAIRWMQFVNRGFFDEEGHHVETQAVGRDITERKQAEQVLAGIRDQLEQQVRERTQSLTEINERLQREIDERHQIEKKLLHKNQRLESMAIELSLAEERERDRIAGELHDQVGQRLIFGKMKLGALASQLQTDKCIKDVEELERTIDLSIQDIRSLTFQLRPPLLASAGLEAALHWLGEEFSDMYGQLLIYSDDGQQKPMRYEARSTVFQAAREMMLNTVKHADATQIGIKIWREGDMLQVCISDDGRGFDVAEARVKKSKSGGFGLINVQRRIEHLGGSIIIESQPGKGTCVTIMAPLDISQ